MDFNISEEEYKNILEKIKNEDSPVGIDAGKTHVLILYKLQKLEEKLEKLEQRLNPNSTQ